MKNIILGMIGCYMVILVLGIGIAVYQRGSRQNEISNAFSAVMRQAMERYYAPQEEHPEERRGFQWNRMVSAEPELQAEIQSFLEEELRLRVDSVSQVSVEILFMDMEKGILSASAKTEFRSLTGTEQCLQFEKTVLVDQAAGEAVLAEVAFYVEEELYKKYRIMAGEPMILPKEPTLEGRSFRGWQEERTGEWYSGQTVAGDSVWKAVFN